MKDDFGDRIKAYETAAEVILDPLLPTYARLDGRSFSKFTKGMRRPFDPKLSWAMKVTAEELKRQFHSRITYTQSDEISLGWFAGIEQHFGGRQQKLLTSLASTATARFNQACVQLGGDYAKRAAAQLPSFDARLFQPPNPGELVNAFIWREHDCRKNAVSMAARAQFSHKALQHKNQVDMTAMLVDINQPFEQLPQFFRQGIFLERVLREIRIDEAMKLTPQFKAENDTVMRSRIIRLRGELPNSFADRMERWTAVNGFFATLTSAQQKRALEYSGDDC